MRHEIRAIDYALNQWGKYEEAQLNLSGYAKINPLFRFMTEGAPGEPLFSSRPLHNGTPLDILKIRQQVEKLPIQQMMVVKINYIYHLKPDGTYLTAEDKAKALEISYPSYKTTLHRARNYLLRYL